MTGKEEDGLDLSGLFTPLTIKGMTCPTGS